MTRATAVRAVLAFAVLAVATFLVTSRSARLGLDLRGGTQIVLETRDSPMSKADRAATDRTLEVLRQRVDALGVAEPSLARAGDRRIIVELPGVQDPRRAAEVLGRTAQLTFHPVLGVSGEPGPTPASTEAPSRGASASATGGTPPVSPGRSDPAREGCCPTSRVSRCGSARRG
jgi:SecD/SecF fusion protein